MADNIAAIPTGGCVVLTGDKSLSWFNSAHTQRKDFIFNGGKWYEYRTQTNNYGYDISQYTCLTELQLSELDTNAQYTGIFFVCGLGFALLLFSLLYKILRLFS